MASITIKIDTDNAAFDDGMRGHEVARILHKLADEYDDLGGLHRPFLHDINGNTVGTVTEQH